MNLEFNSQISYPFSFTSENQYPQVLLEQLADFIASDDHDSFERTYQHLRTFLAMDTITNTYAKAIFSCIAIALFTKKSALFWDEQMLAKTLVDSLLQPDKQDLLAGMDRFIAELSALIWGDTGYENEYVNRVLDFINIYYAQEISFDRIARNLNLSRNYLSCLFHKQAGDSFRNYLLKYRIRKSMELLQKKKRCPMKEICCQVGFKDAAHFSRMFKLIAGCSPSQYKQSGQVDTTLKADAHKRFRLV